MLNLISNMLRYNYKIVSHGMCLHELIPLGYFVSTFLLFVTYFFLYMYLQEVTGDFKPPRTMGVSKPLGIMRF